MTFSAIPYALQNASHSADLFRQATSSLVPAGGGLVTAGDLAVTPTGTASMNVQIGVGRAWIPGTNVGNVVGGNFSQQADYFVQNNGAVTVAIATSDPVNPRIDVVYVAIQDSQYAGTTDAVVPSVVAGVPTAGATYPANAPALPANSIALAWINVPANASSIIASNITQLQTHGFAAPSTLQVLTTTDTTWAYNCQLLTTFTGDGHKYCTLQFIAARTGGGTFNVNTGAWTAILSGLIPSGSRPGDNVTVGGTYEFNGLGAALFKIGTDGAIYASGVTGAFSCGVPTKLSFTAAWDVS